MRHRHIFPLTAVLALLLAGCVYPRPGAGTTPSVGAGSATVTALGAVGGAALGYGIKGRDGALVGAAGGAALSALAANAASSWHNDKIEEAREQGARDERVKVLNDYWQSQAVDKAHEPAGGSGKKTGTTTLQYPAGVYDGVIYGPRTIEVPVAN